MGDGSIEDDWINVDKVNLYKDSMEPLGLGRFKNKNGVKFYLHDLEIFPWPWPNDLFEEVRMNHVLEHLGQTVDIYLDVWKEIYRVCKDGAIVKVVVPHPRHDDFMNDPTHVRMITPESLNLLSKKECRKFRDNHNSNTQLAYMIDVNLELKEVFLIKEADVQELKAAQDKYYNNIFKEIRMALKVVKNEELWGFEVK